MRANSHKIVAFAERLAAIQNSAKEDADALNIEIKAADIDPAGVRRLVAWQRKDPTKRAEQEAIDHQYRFLAGDEAEPAPLPVPSMLADAVDLYGKRKKVRDVAAALKVSVGKAQKLRTLAGLFLVHVQMNMNKPEDGDDDITPHDADGVVIEDTTAIVLDIVQSEVQPPGDAVRDFVGGWSEAINPTGAKNAQVDPGSANTVSAEEISLGANVSGPSGHDLPSEEITPPPATQAPAEPRPVAVGSDSDRVAEPIMPPIPEFLRRSAA